MAPVARMPMNFSTIDNSIRRRAPLLGEHTDELLKELGYGGRRDCPRCMRCVRFSRGSGRPGGRPRQIRSRHI